MGLKLFHYTLDIEIFHLFWAIWVRMALNMREIFEENGKFYKHQSFIRGKTEGLREIFR